MMKFLGGGGKKESPKSSNNKANAFGVDPALFEDPKFEEDEEVDLPEGVDVHAILKEVDTEADIQVTDEDMNDPELLAELNEISGGAGSEGVEEKKQALREQVAQAKKTALACRDKKDMVGAREALNNAKALQAQLDSLSASHAPSSAPVAPKPTPAATPAPTPTPVAAKPAPQPTRPAPVPKAVDPEELLDEDEAPEEENKQAAEIRNRIKTYKMAALTNKQAGNRPAALQYMGSVKLLEKALEDADMGFPVDMKGLPPAVPPPPGDAPLAGSGDSLSSSSSSTSSNRLNSPPMTVMTAAQKEALKRQQTLETLIAELGKMVELHKAAAIAGRDSGDKTGAAAALKQMKEAKSHYDTLVAARTDPSIPLPEHHYETKETKHEVAFDNIAPHELEISVINIKDLKPPAGYTALSLVVYAEIQFNDKEPVQKIQTNAISNTFSPVYNFTTKVMIERNKAFLRYIEKKKITFQVFHSRFLLGNILIGKAEMKLSDLAEKAEVQEDIPILKEGTKRPVGGPVRIRLRLKTPLVKQDVRITKETILVIDGAFPSVGGPATTPTTTPTKPQQTTTSSTTTPTTTTAKTPATPAASATSKTPAKTTTTTSPPTTPTSNQATAPNHTVPTQAAPKPAAGGPQKPAAATQKPAAGGGDEEMDLEDVNSVENIISNDVLENELAAVDAQIAAYAQKKQQPPEALVDRKQAIDLKMSILVIQVQSGQITPEKYVDMLKAKVDEEMALAKKLVVMGKKDWAKFPLQRAKIMKVEIESASAEEEES